MPQSKTIDITQFSNILPDSEWNKVKDRANAIDSSLAPIEPKLTGLYLEKIKSTQDSQQKENKQ